MKEIRIHGRGGQGSLVLAQFMAIAALEDGKFGQAFPYLGGGGERRGKPIVASPGCGAPAPGSPAAVSQRSEATHFHVEHPRMGRG